MDNVQLNWWAILLATLANMIMGGLWYSGLLFGERWMALVGWSKDEAKEKQARGARWYPIVIPVSFVFASCLAVLIHGLHIDSILGGLKLGLLVGLGLMAVPGGPRNAFAGRPFGLYLINHGYWAISAVVLSLILAVWQ